MSNQYPKTAHTRGTTFTRLGLSTLPAGTWSIAAKVYTGAGALVETLGALITALPTPDADGHTHAWSITSDASETALWPLASLMLEVRFSDASNPAVVVPAVSRTIVCSAYTLPSTDADDPLAVITDALAPVLRGEPGPAGADSTVPGPAGDDGVGVPAGGTTGQVLAKASDTNYDTEWVDQTDGSGGGATNLAYTASATQGTVTSDTGTDATLPAADGTNAGLMLPAQVTKLAALPSSADAAGTAASAVAAHAAASDPHGDRAFATAADVAILASANAHAESLVVGLVDDRGNFDASGNTFPASGGSGTAGAVLKGDLWTVSVAGTLGGEAVAAGDLVRALVDAPGQTAGNWAVTESNIGYVPVNAADKDASGGFAGLTGFKLNLVNALGTITSWFTTAATAARTWTLPDKSGTVAMTSDIPATTDALDEGSTNLYSTAARIRGTVLTGLSTAAGTVVAATHTVLEAIGFLQKQASDNASAISGKAATGAIGSSGLTMGTAKLLGRTTDSTGAVEEITPGLGLKYSSGTLTAIDSYNDSNTTNAINLSNGLSQRWAPSTGAQTLSLTNWPATGGQAVVLIEGVNLGAATITWPTINWVKKDGTFTTTIATYLTDAGITLQSSGTDFFMVWSRDGGTTIYGKFLR